MTKHALRSSVLLLAGLIFLSLPLCAQIKKGQKYLKKEKWQEAIAAFTVDSADAELKPVALYGIAQAMINPENPNKAYFEGVRVLDRAVVTFKALKSAQRTELTKDFDISTAIMQKLRSTTGTTAWKEIEKTGTLQQYADFVELFPKATQRTRDKAVAQKNKLLGEAVRNAQTYPELSELTNRFRDDVRAQFPTALDDLDQRVFTLFLQQKGPDALGQFFGENPKSPLKTDPARSQFAPAWKSETPGPMIEFLVKNPGSGYVPFVRRKATELLKTNPVTEEQRAKLSGDARGELAELELAASGKIVDPYKMFRENEREAWVSYVRKAAPSSRALTALEKVYKHYVVQRNWKEAAAILETGKPLFPEHNQWFTAQLAIVSGPEYGIKPVDISRTINEDGSEYVPVPSVDGKTLYFCATNRDDNIDGEDVFVSTKADSGWTKPQIIRELSGSGNQAPLSLSADGNKMLLFKSSKPYQSTRQANNSWSDPIPLDIDMNRFDWVGLVQIAANDQVMVFEARKGNNDVDLFFAKRQSDGKWGKPAALDSLNTKGANDRSPFLHPDMQTLYFSSAGRPGLGGLDLFKTTRLDESWTRWSEPVNLGKEVNTIDDDWAYKISTDGQVAWFSSRTSGRSQDILQINVPKEAQPKPVKIVELNLKDDKGNPFTGKIILENPVNGDTVGVFQASPTGGLTTITVPNDKPYNIRLQQEGYFPASLPIPVQAPGKPLNISAAIKPVNLDNMVKSGQTVALNLLFDYDKAELKPESTGELRTVAEVAIKNNYRINLLGYTDNSGGPDYNQQLSQQRAEAARQILVGFGVKAENITATGYGERNPVASNNTEEGKAKNRRVEVQFVK